MKLKLIDEARQWHKFASVRLAIFAGIVAGFLSANPEVTKQLLDTLPAGPVRVWASAGIGLFVFSLATGARLVKKVPKENDQ